MRSGHNSTKAAENTTWYRHIHGEVSVCLHMYVCIVYVYMCIYMFTYVKLKQLESNRVESITSIEDIH